jgi:hypothetical protein
MMRLPAGEAPTFLGRVVSVKPGMDRLATLDARPIAAPI